MTILCLLAALILVPPAQPSQAAPAQAPQAAPASPPDRTGVFAVTDRGTIELTAFGERQSVEAAIDTFVYRPGAVEQIPSVASVRSFFVNMLGWTPKDLYLIAGHKRLSTPRDDYRRLLGRAYRRGPVLYEVLTERLEPDVLWKEYRSLAGKKGVQEGVAAFVVLEITSETGLNRRGYPIRVEWPGQASTPPK